MIKVLKDLAVGPARFSIDIKVLKDLKRIVTIKIAGDRPPRYGEKNVSLFSSGPLGPACL